MRARPAHVLITLVLSACASGPASRALVPPPRSRAAEAFTHPPGAPLGTGARRDSPDVQTPSDTSIAAAIERRLARSADLRGEEIRVSVQGGVVELSGAVDSLLARRHAHAVVASTRGVRAIVDQLDVLPAARSDEAIETDLRRMLALQRSTNDLRIDVDVLGGAVVLRGTVSSPVEEDIVEWTAAAIRGVREVRPEHEVALENRPSGAELRDDIVARLARDALVEDAWLRVRVDGQRAMLSGTLGSLEQVERAIWIARAAGATEVDRSELDVHSWARDRMRRSTAYRPTPEEIEEAVRDALELDERVDASDLTVEVEAGVAALGGSVDSVAAERAAIEDAMNTLGVWQVAERIAVVPDREIDDGSIEDAVRTAIESSPFVDRSPVTAEVEGGVVTLRGTVSGPYARAVTNRVVAGIDGVVRIDDRLELAGIGEPVADWMLEAAVRDALEWNPRVDASAIGIAVEDGVVTLSGQLADIQAIRAAVREALDAGSARVINWLTIER